MNLRQNIFQKFSWVIGRACHRESGFAIRHRVFVPTNTMEDAARDRHEWWWAIFGLYYETLVCVRRYLWRDLVTRF